MTPFVDVAFLILSFFIMATKFKPPQPVEITTPSSVSADKLKEQDAVMIEMDKRGRVFMTVNTERAEDNELKKQLIKNVSDARNLGLTQTEIDNYANNTTIGVPFNKVKSFLGMDQDGRNRALEGIPVTDSADNQLATWVANAIHTFQGRRLNFLIKGDNDSKYPTFKGIIDALRRNEIFKYQLVTDPEGVPVGTDLYKLQQQ